MEINNYDAGTKINKVCEIMYDKVLETNTAQTHNFNGVRILMFNDSYDIELKKEALKKIKLICNHSKENNDDVTKIANIVRDLF